MADELKSALELFGRRASCIAIRGIRVPDLNNVGHDIIVVNANEYYSVRRDDIIEDEGVCGHTSHIWIKMDAEVWSCKKTVLSANDAVSSKYNDSDSFPTGHDSEALLSTSPHTVNLNWTLTPIAPGTAAAARKPSYQVLQGIVLDEIHTSGATVAWLLGKTNWDDQGKKTEGLNFTPLQLAETRDNVNQNLSTHGYLTAPAATITLGDISALIKDKTVGDFVNAFAKALSVTIPGKS
jgi:hypothetical protein